MEVISTQGSGPVLGCKVEIEAIKSILATPFEDLKQKKFAEGPYDAETFKNTLITGQKGQVGHLNFLSGITELVFMVKAMDEGVVPFIYGLEEPIDDQLNFVRHGDLKKKNFTKMMKFAMGFGGNMSSVALEKYSHL